MPQPILRDSITDATAEDAGRVVVSGSHGGLYPAAIASRVGLHAVIFNDAGIGLDDAGLAGVIALDRCGMAAAAADTMSCLIGSAADMMAHGRISHANAAASAVGVAPGMPVAQAAARLERAAPPTDQLDPVPEARWEEPATATRPALVMVDSASLVRPEDQGRIVITGSHGGLIGGDPARALKAAARLAVFNDAGIGKAQCGISRLPALAERGIAAVCVSHDSSHIGSAASALATGAISHANAPARTLLGPCEGQALAQLL